MANVYQFPKANKPMVAVPKAVPDAVSTAAPKKHYGLALYRGFYFVFVLLSPLIRWILYVDVTWQFFRMIYFWDTPGVYAGWTFLGHFILLMAVIFFVACGGPKDHKNLAAK